MRHPARLWTILVLSLFVLAACKPQPQPQPMAFAAPAGMRSMALAAAPEAAKRRIAFTESFVVELPGSAVEATQQKTVQSCLAAGCSVLNTRLDRLPDGSVQGSISVRIAPDRFQALADAITAPPARLVSHAATAEDKTTPLLDIEKRLGAQVALRDRLAEMLKQAGTSVGDLVAVERQLADVQGTIESETAQRDYLRTVTDTVMVDVSYNGLVQQAGPVDLSPIRVAFDRFVQTAIESFGDMVGWVAYALPWLPLVALGGWGGFWIVRRLRRSLVDSAAASHKMD
jgi:glycine cleavage system regulatory protein